MTDRAFERLTTHPLRRGLSLTTLGLNVGGRFLLHNLRNTLRSPQARHQADRDFYRRQGEALAAQLGRLKGGMMKAGQLLALYGDYLLPPEAVQALDVLQSFSVPAAWSVVEPVLRRELGARLRDLEIEREPIGAASLGQVHRARLRGSDRELCLKVQYPGVGDAIDSDVAMLARIFALSRLAPSNLDLRPTFDEVRQMLYREVDYRRERCYAVAFRRRLAGDPRFVVPETLSEYSTRRVLTMTYEDGVDVHDAAVQALPQPRRNRFARALVALFLRELFAWRMVQTDPNFGNYRFRLRGPNQDCIVLLDFGASRTFPRRFVKAYAELVRGAMLQDTAMTVRGAVALGILDAGFPRQVLDGFATMCKVIAEPFTDPARGHIEPRLLNAEGAYRWADSDLPARAGRAMMSSALTVHYRLPPPEIVFLHRRLTGTFVMLAALHAELDARPELLEALQIAGGKPAAAGL